MIYEERGSVLVEAIWVMTFLTLIGSTLLGIMLSERQAIGGIGLSDAALVEADGIVDRVRLAISTPMDQGGWGDAYTTGPAGESIDTALARGHFARLGSGKIMVQRTNNPLERRVSAIIDSQNSLSGGSRIVQAIVRLESKASAGTGSAFGISILPGKMEGLDGAQQPALSLERVEITVDNGSQDPIGSLWLGHDVSAALSGVALRGDAFAHEAVAFEDTVSTMAGGALITFGSVTGREFVSGEIIEGYGGGKHDDRFAEFERIEIKSRDYYRKAASALITSSINLCSDSLGRVHAAPEVERCVASDANLIRDRWGDPISDGIIYVDGDVAMSGIYAGIWTVVAGGANCVGPSDNDAPPCGHVYIGDRSDGPDSLELKTGVRCALSVVGGRIFSDATDTPETISASMLATLEIELAPTANPAGKKLRITQPIRSLGRIRIGNSWHQTELSITPIAADTHPEDFRVAEVGTRVISWQEVLPSKQRRLLLSKSSN